MRDFQRSKLYSWEREFLKTGKLIGKDFNRPLGRILAQGLVDLVWREWMPHGYTAPIVEVKANRGRGSAWAQTILLSSKYETTQTAWYVLHESTHSMLMQKGRGDLSPHGAEFCALYSSMLHRFTDAKRAAIVSSMRAARLKVNGRLLKSGNLDQANA